MGAMETNSIHEDLKFLLHNGWSLIGPNTVEYSGTVTNDITKAAKYFRIKLDLQIK